MTKKKPKKSGEGIDKSHPRISIQADTVNIGGDVVGQDKISTEPKIISLRNYEKMALFDKSGPRIVQTIPQEIDDAAKAERGRIIGMYLNAIKMAAKDPTGPIVTVDITGAATGFRNWIEDELYRWILTFNKHYDEAFRRRHGNKGPGVIRNFIIDPTGMDIEAIENLQSTLNLHVKMGLEASIIYTGSKVPTWVIADIATISDRLAVDVGHLERLDTLDIGPKDVFADVRDKQFEEIRDRVAWTMQKKNITKEVTRQEDVDVVIRNLKKRSRL